jgi:hypothetical protein
MAPVAAQDAPIAIGEPLTYVDPEGITRGTVTVTEVADPFTEHDPSAPPAEGMRYVLLTVRFEAAADQTFDASPGQILLLDSDGFISYPQYVPRPPEAVMPDLQGQTMAPGNVISGVVPYIVPATARLQQVVFQPSYDRLLGLAELAPGSGPAIGDAVPYTDAEGGSATITSRIEDPFTGYDPAYPPPADQRYVVLVEAFDNVGQRPYYADPYDFALRDVTGLLFQPGSVYLPADATMPLLESQTMSPGDHVSGLLGFTVPASAQLQDVLYYPESGRIMRIASLTGGAAPTEPTTSSPSAAPVTSPAPDASAGTGR